jgi:hypothetical protein
MISRIKRVWQTNLGKMAVILLAGYSVLFVGVLAVGAIIAVNVIGVSRITGVATQLDPRIFPVLVGHQRQHGSLPFNARGPEVAVREMARDLNENDRRLPANLGALRATVWGHPDTVDPASYPTGPTYYVNQPNLALRPTAPHRVILLLECPIILKGEAKLHALTESGVLYSFTVEAKNISKIPGYLDKPVADIATLAKDIRIVAIDLEQDLGQTPAFGDLFPFKQIPLNERKATFGKKDFYDLLMEFKTEHGTFPYDARGGQYALFQLKDYARPILGKVQTEKELEALSDVSWAFDLEKGEVKYAIDYLNPNDGKGGYVGFPDDVIILASRPAKSGLQILFPVHITDIEGRLSLLDPRSPALQKMDTFVGKSAADLIAASTGFVAEGEKSATQ